MPKRFGNKPARTSHRPDDGNAFLPDFGSGPARTKDDLAEELAEEFLASATSGEGQGMQAHEAEVAEELGGPFITTSSKTELVDDVDASNPHGALREPFPVAVAPARGTT